MNTMLLTGDASTIGGILDLAGELLTWCIEQMGSIVTFITSNPIILILLIFSICGFAVGMLFRIWNSVG